MTDWAGMIALAHRLGWSPSEFWQSTHYEFTTVLAAEIEAANPVETPDPDAVRSMFRARSDHRIVVSKGERTAGRATRSIARA